MSLLFCQKLLLLFVFLQFLGCANQEGKVNLVGDEGEKPEAKLESYFTDIQGVRDYSLHIETILRKNKKPEPDWVNDFRNDVVVQSMIFMQGDSVLSVRKHEIKFKNEKPTLSETCAITIITNIGFDMMSEVYVIEGSGGACACSEYIAEYSMDGTILWHSYSCRADDINISENFEEESKKVDNSQLRKIASIAIYPKQVLGDTLWIKR